MQTVGASQEPNADVPIYGSALQVPTPLWDAIRGERPAKFGSWALYRTQAELLGLDDLTLPPEIARPVPALPPLFASGEVNTLIVRGPQHNGRRTLMGAIAGM